MMNTQKQGNIVINIINGEKADEVIKLGFHCSKQKLNDKDFVYQFVSSPELMKILSSRFENTDFFIGKTMCM